MEWFKQMVTGKDNKTVDVGRVVALIGTLVFFAGSLVSLYRGVWDGLAYATALGAILVATGLGLKAKETTEPGA
jgi:hypothetical protein